MIYVNCIYILVHRGSFILFINHNHFGYNSDSISVEINENKINILNASIHFIVTSICYRDTKFILIILKYYVLVNQKVFNLFFHIYIGMYFFNRL